MTGGGLNQSKPLDNVEQKLKSMIKLSVDGLPPEFDCDANANVGDNNEIMGTIILLSND